MCLLRHLLVRLHDLLFPSLFFRDVGDKAIDQRCSLIGDDPFAEICHPQHPAIFFSNPVFRAVGVFPLHGGFCLHQHRIIIFRNHETTDSTAGGPIQLIGIGVIQQVTQTITDPLNGKIVIRLTGEHPAGQLREHQLNLPLSFGQNILQPLITIAGLLDGEQISLPKVFPH